MIQKDYGIDWDDPLSCSADQSVLVSDTECPLFAQQLGILKHTTDPLEECADYGVQLHVETRAFVNAVRYS